MYINIYRDLMINNANNIHYYCSSEEAFLSAIESKLVEAINNEASMNYLPNSKEFMLSLSNMANATLITYIVWFTGSAYKHFRVVSYEIFSTYVIYRCESDLWADSVYNTNFANSKLRLTRSNMTYIKAGETIPAYYETINFTKNNFSDSELSMYSADTNQPIPNPNSVFRAYILVDKEIDRKDVNGFIYGISTKQCLYKVLLDSGRIDTWIDHISRLVQDNNGNKITVRKCYFLPFNLDSGEATITAKWKQNGGGLGDLPLQPFYNNIVPVVVYTDIEANDYNNGNNKIYVGAGYSLMEVVRTIPKTRIYYRFILNTAGIKAYVEQGDNTKEITEAYTIQITTNDGLLTTQESISKIIGTGLKITSGALATAGGAMSGNPILALGGITSMINAGIDLIPNQKSANYTAEGDAVSTYVGSNWFNKRTFTAINNIESYTMLYGINYNYYTSVYEAIHGTIIEAGYRPYIKAEVIELPPMTVEQYNFVKAEIERGIYITEPIIPIHQITE